MVQESENWMRPLGIELPPKGFEVEDLQLFGAYRRWFRGEGKVDPKSERLQLLDPFTPIKPESLQELNYDQSFWEKMLHRPLFLWQGPWLRF